MNKVNLIKEVREITGLGIAECKNALEATNWQLDSAVKHAKENSKPSDKPVGAGAIFSYIHHNRLIGALLELHCATDFVARNEEFIKLGNDLVLHIAAMHPVDIDDLLNQPFLKNTAITVKTLIREFSAKVNEPIKVHRFHKYVLGVN